MPFTWNNFEQKIKDMTTDEEYEKLQVSADFSSKLIKARVRMNFTQNDLAERAGLKQSAIARIETKGSLPRIDTVYKLANALDSKIDFYPIDVDEEKTELGEIKDILESLKKEVKVLNENLRKLSKPKIIININNHQDSKSDFEYDRIFCQSLKPSDRKNPFLKTDESRYRRTNRKFQVLKER